MKLTDDVLADIKAKAEAATQLTQSNWYFYDYGPDQKQGPYILARLSQELHLQGNTVTFGKHNPCCACYWPAIGAGGVDEDHLRAAGHHIARMDPPTTLALLDKIEGLRGIVAKLPVTADGVPVTPRMPLWLRMDDGEYAQDNAGDIYPRVCGADHCRLSECYSTREAAEAARKDTPNA